MQLGFDQSLKLSLLRHGEVCVLIACGTPTRHEVLKALLLRGCKELIRAQTLHNH